MIENRLERELSKGKILEEYVIKFFKENNLSDFNEEIIFFSRFITELENILFLLDSKEKDLKRVILELDTILKKFKSSLTSSYFKKKNTKKLLSATSSWDYKKKELNLELFLKDGNEQKSNSLEKNRKKIESDTRRVISKVLDAITEYQNNQTEGINNIVEIIKKHYKISNKSINNQVFLSHAFADRLYTLGLFLYFYDQNVYLYIDWMSQDENSKTVALKKNLTQEIKNSNQLLFLRTLNSELLLQGGKKHIREWCAWEIGTFDYKINGLDNKRFYIDRYRLNKKRESRSQLIQDFQPLKGIKDGRLF